MTYLFDTPEINYNQGWRYFDEYNQDTDWLSYVRKNSFITDNSFSMSGGGDRATYRAALSYLYDDGTTIGTSLQRFTLSLNVGYNFSDKLRVDAEYTYSNTDKHANWTESVRGEAMRKMPNKSPYYIDDETGDMTDTYFVRQNADEFQGAFSAGSSRSASNVHPIIVAHESENKMLTNEQKMTVRLNYAFNQAFTYTGYVSMKFKTTNTTFFLPQAATDVSIDNSYANLSEDNNANNLSLQTENKFMFRKRWNEDRQSIVAALLWRTAQSTSSYYDSQIAGAPSAVMYVPITVGTVLFMCPCLSDLG